MLSAQYNLICHVISLDKRGVNWKKNRFYFIISIICTGICITGINKYGAVPVVTNVCALVSISTISLEIKLWLNKCSTGTGTYLFSGLDFLFSFFGFMNNLSIVNANTKFGFIDNSQSHSVPFAFVFPLHCSWSPCQKCKFS